MGVPGKERKMQRRAVNLDRPRRAVNLDTLEHSLANKRYISTVYTNRNIHTRTHRHAP